MDSGLGPETLSRNQGAVGSVFRGFWTEQTPIGRAGVSAPDYTLDLHPPC